MSPRPTKFVAFAVCLALGLGACGSDDSSTDEAVDSAAGTTLAPEPSATEAPDTTVSDSTASSATDAPDTSVEDSVEDGVFDTFEISFSQSGDTTLVDPAGMTLYVFTNDPWDNSVSTCYEGCASTWPPVTVGNVEELSFGDGVDPEDVNFLLRDDGGIQVTFFGAPLYYYVGDSAPGDVNGDGIGGVWFPALEAANDG